MIYSQAAGEIILVKLKYFYKTKKYSFGIGKMAKNCICVEQFFSLPHLVVCSFAPNKLKSIMCSVCCLILGAQKRATMQGVIGPSLIQCQAVINAPSLQEE